MVADFDFGCLADVLGTHIGFLEANCEANFSHALAKLLMSLCIAVTECVAKATSSAKSTSRTSTVRVRV